MSRTLKIVLAVGTAGALLIVVARTLGSQVQQKIDLQDGVYRIELRGSKATLRITSSQSANTLGLTAKDSMGCSTKASVRQNQETVLVNVSVRRDFPGFRCGPLAVTLPQGFGLDLRFEKVAASIAGNYADIQINSGKSAVNFDGAATQFKVQGEAAVVNLKFTNAIEKDALQLNVPNLASHVIFAPIIDSH